MAGALLALQAMLLQLQHVLGRGPQHGLQQLRQRPRLLRREVLRAGVLARAQRRRERTTERIEPLSLFEVDFKTSTLTTTPCPPGGIYTNSNAFFRGLAPGRRRSGARVSPYSPPDPGAARPAQLTLTHCIGIRVQCFGAVL